jgi:uncharacterized protein YndB with AHSA1/START domain
MRSIEYISIVEASLSDVWDAWTTNAGVQTFFAPESDIDLRIGGQYELYFDLDAPPGDRGSEGMKVQSYIPERMLAFDWNQPASIPDLRNIKTWVVVEFREMDDELSEITLTHLGFGEGSTTWNQAYEYFQNAWKKVLLRFERSVRIGAIDWNHRLQD